MTDKRAFMIYFAVRIATLLMFAGGLIALRGDRPILGTVLLLAGAAGFLIRPRHILPGR